MREKEAMNVPAPPAERCACGVTLRGPGTIHLADCPVPAPGGKTCSVCGYWPMSAGHYCRGARDDHGRWRDAPEDGGLDDHHVMCRHCGVGLNVRCDWTDEIAALRADSERHRLDNQRLQGEVERLTRERDELVEAHRKLIEAGRRTVREIEAWAAKHGA